MLLCLGVFGLKNVLSLLMIIHQINVLLNAFTLIFLLKGLSKIHMGKFSCCHDISSGCLQLEQ